MIPPFDEATGNLPPGIHEAMWDEFKSVYGFSPHRQILLAGLKSALEQLRAAGCRRAYVDGSFVTDKEQPGDFDCCWELAGVRLTDLDPVLMTFANRRAAQKQKYGGELFPADGRAISAGATFLRFFQRDKDTGQPKGIVAIDLRRLP